MQEREGGSKEIRQGYCSSFGKSDVDLDQSGSSGSVRIYSLFWIYFQVEFMICVINWMWCERKRVIKNDFKDLGLVFDEWRYCLQNWGRLQNKSKILVLDMFRWRCLLGIKQRCGGVRWI